MPMEHCADAVVPHLSCAACILYWWCVVLILWCRILIMLAVYYADGLLCQ